VASGKWRTGQDRRQEPRSRCQIPPAFVRRSRSISAVSVDPASWWSIALVLMSVLSAAAGAAATAATAAASTYLGWMDDVVAYLLAPALADQLAACRQLDRSAVLKGR